jgi:hypothetical protein
MRVGEIDNQVQRIKKVTQKDASMPMKDWRMDRRG